MLAKIRIKTEHCNGLIKERFQFFKSIRVALSSRKDMRRIINYFTCAVILHNLLTGEPISEDWERAIHENGLSDDDELNTPVPRYANDNERRNQLFAYFMEIRGK